MPTDINTVTTDISLGTQEDQKQLPLAVIRGPHGIHGAVKVEVFVDPDDATAEYLCPLSPYLCSKAPDRKLMMTSFRKLTASNGLTRFEGISSRTDAEYLRGWVLTVPRDRLPPAPQGQTYLHDMIGATVYASPAVMDNTGLAITNTTPDNETSTVNHRSGKVDNSALPSPASLRTDRSGGPLLLGTVVNVVDYGASPLLKINDKDGRELLIPFTDDIIDSSRLDQGLLYVDHTFAESLIAIGLSSGSR